MATFYKETNSIPLFGSSGKFYAKAKISVNVNPNNKKQFTVTLDGIRAYSKYGWNFTTHLSTSLAKDRSGTGAITDTGTITKSYNNEYVGWLPSSGYNNSANISKTFNYNSDGTIPDVYLKFRAYNGTVYYINGGHNVSVSVSYHENIKADIKDAIGELDVSAAKFSVNKTSENATTIGFKTTLNSKNSNSPTKWYVQVDNTDHTYKTSSNIEYSYKVTNSTHTIKVDNENSYGKRAGWKTLNYDTTLPTIKSKDLEPISINKARLKYDCSHDCNWSLSGKNMPTITGSGQIVDTEVTIASDVNQEYTLTVTRKDNSTLSVSVPIICNTITPKLTLNNISTVADAMHIKVTSDIPCKDWKFEIIKVEDNSVVKSITSSSWNGSKVIQTIISPLELEVPYILRVSATNNVNRGLTTKITSNEITCHGCVYIINGADEVLGAAMIYDKYKKRWVGSIPYVYDEEKGWLRTTVK